MKKIIITLILSLIVLSGCGIKPTYLSFFQEIDENVWDYMRKGIYSTRNGYKLADELLGTNNLDKENGINDLQVLSSRSLENMKIARNNANNIRTGNVEELDELKEILLISLDNMLLGAERLESDSKIFACVLENESWEEVCRPPEEYIEGLPGIKSLRNGIGEFEELFMEGMMKCIECREILERWGNEMEADFTNFLDLD